MKLQEVNHIKWTDDNGQTYKRTIKDGEIKEIPVNA